MLSDAGEPASPSAAAVPTNAIVAIGLKPISSASGTKIVAMIGIVEKGKKMMRQVNRLSIAFLIQLVKKGQGNGQAKAH